MKALILFFFAIFSSLRELFLNFQPFQILNCPQITVEHVFPAIHELAYSTGTAPVDRELHKRDQNLAVIPQPGSEFQNRTGSYNKAMSGIQFVMDEKGRKVAVQIDLKKHGAIWEDFWDGLVSESRRSERSVPYEQYRARRLKRIRKTA